MNNKYHTYEHLPPLGENSVIFLEVDSIIPIIPINEIPIYIEMYLYAKCSLYDVRVLKIRKLKILKNIKQYLKIKLICISFKIK